MKKRPQLLKKIKWTVRVFLLTLLFIIVSLIVRGIIYNVVETNYLEIPSNYDLVITLSALTLTSFGFSIGICVYIIILVSKGK